MTILLSCKKTGIQEMDDIEVWKISWRMIASSMEENYELASLQFDSLRLNPEPMGETFLTTGLIAKMKIGDDDAIAEVLSSLGNETLEELCRNPYLANFESCDRVSVNARKEVENKELQLELIKMYIEDQAARGNMMEDIITKFDLDSTDISLDDGVTVDKRNRNRLKAIIEEYGFPTQELVGEDAMQGVFFIIQHSDGDKEWQKSQFGNIEKAVKKGDLDGQKYAYLYDRIKINSGEKQLYGTQFSNVDPANGIVELAQTEDIENLNKRRMEIGMMPIEMYKEFMLKSLQ